MPSLYAEPLEVLPVNLASFCMKLTDCFFPNKNRPVDGAPPWRLGSRWKLGTPFTGVMHDLIDHTDLQAAPECSQKQLSTDRPKLPNDTIDMLDGAFHLSTVTSLPEAWRLWA